MRLFNKLKHSPSGYLFLFVMIPLLLCSCTMSRSQQSADPVAENNPHSQNGIPAETAAVHEVTFEPVPQISLSGSSEVMDNDSNGLYEYLTAEVEVLTDREGTAFIEAFLLSADGSFIDRGNLFPELEIQMAADITHCSLEQGAQKLRIYFNGKAIRDAKTDSPYTIQVQILGFTKEDTSLEITTSPYRADEFQGPLAENRSITEFREDTDYDGLYNALVVQMKLDVLASGNFFITGSLFSGNTAVGHTVVEKALKKGNNTVRLVFDGRALRCLEADGSYQVYITIDDGYYSENIEYETKVYLYSDFQRTNAFFTGKFSEYTIDSDDDGLKDELNIDTQVQADVWGVYEVQGILEDKDGNFLGTSEKKVNLKDAPSEVVLNFEGRRIYESGSDGSYQLSLTILDISGEAVAGKLYTTKAYTHTMFEQPQATVDAILSDTPMDVNADGLNDHLRLNIEVNAAKEGVYQVEGSLFADERGEWITTVQKEFSLVQGKNVLNLNFGGELIHNCGTDGPYQIRIDVYTSDGEWVCAFPGEYRTGFYSRDAFQPSDIFTTGKFSCLGEDADENGLYEYIAFSVEISVPREGTYDFQARLADKYGRGIVCYYDHAALRAGIQTITMKFNGQFIYDSKTDGPYSVKDLYIYNREDAVGEEFTDVFLTPSWRWSEFQQIGIFDDHSGPP